MADPLRCLRNTTIAIAFWNIVSRLIRDKTPGDVRFVCLGHRVNSPVSVVLDHPDGRHGLAGTGGQGIAMGIREQGDTLLRGVSVPRLPLFYPTFSGNPFQARFPGLYQLYTETPERRRVNGRASTCPSAIPLSALYVIVLINIVLAVLHLLFSIALLYGTFKVSSSSLLLQMLSTVPETLHLAVDPLGRDDHSHVDDVCCPLVERGRLQRPADHVGGRVRDVSRRQC